MRTDIKQKSMFYGASPTTLRTAALLRKNMTLAEKVLWKRLRNRTIFNTKFRRQQPINFFIVDFYCHEYKLVVEVDGEIHSDEELHEYDLGRAAELNKFGITVIRFTNDQIIFKIDWVIAEIRKVIVELTPLQGGRGAGGKILLKSAE